MCCIDRKNLSPITNFYHTFMSYAMLLSHTFMIACIPYIYITRMTVCSYIYRPVILWSQRSETKSMGCSIIYNIYLQLPHDQAWHQEFELQLPCTHTILQTVGLEPSSYITTAEVVVSSTSILQNLFTQRLASQSLSDLNIIPYLFYRGWSILNLMVVYNHHNIGTQEIKFGDSFAFLGQNYFCQDVSLPLALLVL